MESLAQSDWSLWSVFSCWNPSSPVLKHQPPLSSSTQMKNLNFYFHFLDQVLLFFLFPFETVQPPALRTLPLLFNVCLRHAAADSVSSVCTVCVSKGPMRLKTHSLPVWGFPPAGKSRWDPLGDLNAPPGFTWFTDTFQRDNLLRCSVSVCECETSVRVKVTAASSHDLPPSVPVCVSVQQRVFRFDF